MTIGELLVAINGDTSGLDKALGKAQTNTKTAMDKITDMVGLGAVAWKGIGLAVDGIKFNAMMESAQVSFGIMLGSVDDAKQKLKDLKYLADHSPLTFTGVTAATTTLLQFGIAGDKVIPTVKMLGDVAGGNEERMQRLALAFAQVSAAGKIQGQDLLQMINAGYNPLMTISKKTGESMAELRKRMEAGGISAKEVAEAFETVTSKGGQFYGMLDANAKTLTGSFTTLQDASQTFLGRTMEAFNGPVKTAIQATTAVLNIIPGQLSAIALTAGTVATAAMAIGVKFQLALGPIGLASAAIGALVAMLAVGADEVNKLAQAKTDRLNSDFKSIAENSKMTSEQSKDLFEKIDKIEYAASRWNGSAKDTAGYIEKLAAQSGISKENVANILLNSERTSDAIKTGAEGYLNANGLTIIGKATAEERLSIETKKAEKAAEEAAASATTRKVETDRLALNEQLKQQSIDQTGYYVGIVDYLRHWNLEVGYIGKSNEEVIAQTQEQANYVWDVVQAYKDANGAIAKNASDIDHALEVEKTGQQIVLGYRNQALLKQATANDLEKTYQDNLKAIEATWKSVTDGLTYAGTQFSSLASSAAKFGNADLSKLLTGMADIAKDAGNLTSALAKGDYIAAAVSGVALIADAWSMLWGDQSEAQKKADEEAKKAEEARIAAVKALENEYQAKFDNDLVRLEKERDERVAYARSIGADVLNIERYYAGEIAKINKARIEGTTKAEEVAAQKQKEISEKYLKGVANYNNDKTELDRLREKGITALAKIKADSEAYIAQFQGSSYATLLQSRLPLVTQALNGLTEEMRNALEDVNGELNLFTNRFTQAFDGIGQSLTDALKAGKTQADFRTTILDMLRNMAIDAAILAGGFQEKFKDIGVAIAEALKDGFQEGELDSISASIDKLYADALVPITKINELFAGKGIISSGAQTALDEISKAKSDAAASAAKAPGFSSGTTSAPGGWSWVGEDGPELRYIPRGAQIIPAAQSSALVSSFSSSVTRGDTNINIQSNAPLDPIQTAQMVRQTQESLAFAGVA